MNTLSGARTHDHKVKSLALYRLSYESTYIYICYSLYVFNLYIMHNCYHYMVILYNHF